MTTEEYKISDTTVGNILRDKGIFPSSERGKQSNWGHPHGDPEEKEKETCGE